MVMHGSKWRGFRGSRGCPVRPLAQDLNLHNLYTQGSLESANSKVPVIDVREEGTFLLKGTRI